MPDIALENHDRYERRSVWERQPTFLLFGERKILECLWVKVTLLKEPKPEPSYFDCTEESPNS